jgi:hypothetical protein
MSGAPSIATPDEGPCDERTAAACYIATLSADLAAMAKRQGLDTLAYILDMARLEAGNHSGSRPGPT